MKYKDTRTGEIYSREELEKLFEQFIWMMKRHFDSFEEYLDYMLQTQRLEEVEK